MIRRAAALLALLVLTSLVLPAASLAAATDEADCPVQTGTRAERAASLGLQLSVEGRAVEQLQGEVEPGDTIRAEVSVAQDCEPPVELTLASYAAAATTFTPDQRLIDSETVELPGDDEVLEVTAPLGCFQIDLAYGPAIADLSQETYGERLIAFANGGEEPCAPSTPPDCPEPGMSREEIREQLDQDPLLSEAVRPGEDVEVAFTIPVGCAPVQLTLASYESPAPTFSSDQELFDHETETFESPGRYDLEVTVPDCYYQVDFAFGPVIRDLDEDTLYGDRLIDHANGGTELCNETITPGPDETATPGPDETTTPGPDETTTPGLPGAPGPGQEVVPGQEVLPREVVRPVLPAEVAVPPALAPAIPEAEGLSPSGAVLAQTGLPAMVLLPLSLLAAAVGAALVRRNRRTRH